MGRFWLGIGLLVLCLVLGLWSGIGMDDRHRTICQTLEQAAQQAQDGNLNSGMQMVQQAQTQWDDSWHATAAMADHAPMDEIDGLFAQTLSYATTGNTTEFASHCSRLSKLVAAVGEAHSLSWWNFL